MRTYEPQLGVAERAVVHICRTVARCHAWRDKEAGLRICSPCRARLAQSVVFLHAALLSYMWPCKGDHYHVSE